MRRRFSSIALGLALTAGSVAIPTLLAHAQITSGLNAVGSTIILPSTDPRVIAANIINIALGLIGIVLVSLIIYAGFLYMTSGGEADKVGTAKKIILNAVIGLVIVLSAWAITRYVISRLLEATGGAGGGVTEVGGGGGGIGGLGGGGGATAFRVQSISPAGSVSIRNIQVKIVFTRPVDPSGTSGIVVMKSGGATVGGTVDISGSIVTFTPVSACPPPNADKKCFDADTDYLVKVGGSVRSTSGATVSCSGFGAICDGKFRSGSAIDTSPPTVKLTFPTDGMSVRANSVQKLFADAADDAGVAAVEFFDGGSSLGADGPAASTTPLTFTASADWLPSSASLGAHVLSAIAKDVDTNESSRSSVSVVVRPEHCFNGTLDAPLETGIDCGGDASSADYCGACAGGSCVKSSDCSSGACVGGICVIQPVISSVSPLNGKAGTFVTVNGTNFGTSPGTVIFFGGPGTADDKLASPPKVCTDAGVVTWSNTQAIVAVPDGAASGPIEVKNTSGLADATNDSRGPSIPNFVVDGTERPGLCAVQPSSETVGNFVEAVGDAFGGGTGKILLSTTGGSADATVDTWSASRVRFRVPVVDTGVHTVSVQSAGGVSNAVEFTVREKIPTAAPVISSIDPVSGPPQQYLTIFGSNFGGALGKVTFRFVDGSEAIGDTSFPAACASAGFWRDDRISIKAPSVFTSGKATENGKYKVIVTRPDGAASNEGDFTMDASIKLAPGLCAIEPSVGPLGTAVKLYGERFGSEKPLVTFYLGKPAVVDSHADQEVESSVPGGALTGPVTLSAGGLTSNRLNFQVRNCNESPDICAAGKEQCCPTGECRPLGDACGAKAVSAAYAWQTSTGLIPIAPRVVEDCSAGATPSPTPWDGRAGGDQAPIDASVFMRFTRKLTTDSARASAFRFLKCTSKSTEPCATQTKVDFSVSHTLAGTDQSLIELIPVAKFDVSTTYEVKALTTVKADGPDGASMDGDKRCPSGPSGETYGYCFRFKTRATTAASTVGSVDVAPTSLTMSASGETAAYKALPIASSDACIVLNCRSFDWEWYTGTATAKNSDKRASVTSVKLSSSGTCEQTGTGISETGEVPVNVNASLLTTGPAGVGSLFVKFQPPRVESYFPNCQESCSNVQITALFSAALDETSVKTPGNVEIRKCANENCVESELSDPLALGGKAVNLIPPPKSGSGAPARLLTIDAVSGGKSILEPGGFYRVLLKGGPSVPGGIRGKNGVPLTGLNHPLGFQWTFRVKPGADATCTPDRVDVTPLQKIETAIGARQLFVATAVTKPDACSADGETIVPLSPAGWTTSDATVADFYKVTGALIDTGGTLPPGCSGTCKATGASAVYGKVAVCGNGVIETTDKLWCDKIKASVPAGKCVVMDPTANAGEECEPSIFGDACDPETCLFRPVKTVLQTGGTCGDGIIQYDKGEACDFGLRCVGGSKSTSAPVPEGTACGTDAEKKACGVAGGTCTTMDMRGCSANCRHLGAAAGKSSCGIGDPLGDGKDCDDGNKTAGDGCSSQCLHEGSSPSTVLPSVCGNAVLEPGETCERPSVTTPWSAVPGCDPKTCLRTGTSACGGPGDANCCGNGKRESGEDCDDGNSKSGDGCSASCLLEGSSIAYSGAKGELTPSFCSNGVLEVGEQCEVGEPSNVVVEKKGALDVGKTQTGDGTDPAQLAFIVGDKLPDSSGLLTADLSATIDGKTGKASYGLQCGLKDEYACSNPEFGLDAGGCCAPRPKVEFKYPNPGDTGVCRNVLIQAGFNVTMDIASVVGSVELSQAAPSVTAPCPSSTKEVLVEATYGPGLLEWLRHAWDRLIAVVTGHPAYAEKWCTGLVTGQLSPVGATSTKLFALNLDRSLSKSTKYRIRFLGDNSTTSTDPLLDNADPAKKLGVKTLRGVVRAFSSADTGTLAWTFTTGDTICNVNAITIADVTPDPAPPALPHPFLFTNANNKPETRQFAARAVSVKSGVAVSLSTTADYDWTWLPWSESSLEKIVRKPVAGVKPSEASVTSQQLNGTSILTAVLQVSKDTVNVPPTTSSTVKGIARVSVLVCENPWPSLTTSPFADVKSSPSLAPGDPFYAGPFYNFSTMYCRDAGNGADTTDDLPALRVNQIPPTLLDYGDGILRQYLFTYPDDSSLPDTNPYKGQGLKQDGIGIRIYSNPQHLSPAEWYASRGFTGSPSAAVVDGYPAVKDAATTYVAATNLPNGTSGKMYSNMFVLSHNPDAKPVTTEIFDKLVSTLAFNINPEFTTQSNVCVTSLGAPFTDDAHPTPIACSADWECLRVTSTLHCDSTKLKLIRDTQRLGDFQSLTRALDAKKDDRGRFPQLSGGTFLQTQTNSLWPSWSSEFGAALGSSPPTDPVNHFLTCGQCRLSSEPCQTNDDCAPVAGIAQTCKGGSYDGKGVWTFDDAIDPQSCWNQPKHAFICPQMPAGQYGVSRLYRYESLSGGLRYDLGAEFEVPPAIGLDGKIKTDTWWSPPLANAAYRCANPPVAGTSCANSTGTAGDDRLCRACPNGNCNTCQTGADAGKFCASSADCAGGASCSGDSKVPVVVGSCQNVGASYTFTGICRNLAVGDAGRCGDGVLNPGETCEVDMTSSAACTTSTGAPGHKKQICDLKDCSRFIDDPLMPQCVADLFCGNGRIDKACVGGTSPGAACSADADCGGGTCKSETCDDGSLNGKYGHCNTTCDGYGGYCGDGLISPGETCDNGSKNGEYGGTCGTDCRSVGPYCGDLTVNGPEECDGQTETAKGVCIVVGEPTFGKGCSTDSDCVGYPFPGACGGNPTDASTKLCSDKVIVGGIAYDTQHVRTCRAPGDSKQCTFNAWSGCVAKGSCGDGIKDAGEACDNGTANSDTGACTTQCKKNVCGDGNVFVGTEECDNGIKNGEVTCSADYDSSCLSCSTSCKFMATAGGYCGDAIKNGPEQCDGKAGLEGANDSDASKRDFCQSLGYDFVKIGVNRTLMGSTGIEKCSEVTGSVSCTSACGYSGCGRCTDAPEDRCATLSPVTGTVLDGVYTDKPVPKARVTLQFRGVKIFETITDDKGGFELKNLNNRSECDSYRIVVDFYGDNPNTPPDESLNGGYTPYTSDAFQPTTFRTDGLKNSEGKIFLIPRGSAYETTVSVGWIGDLTKIPKGGLIRAHLRLPAAFSTLDYSLCGGVYCLKDLTPIWPGPTSLTASPYAQLVCTPGSSGACTDPPVAPMVMKYSRKYFGKDTFDLFLEDFNDAWWAPARNYADPLKLSVTVVTVDGSQTFVAKPKSTAEYCGDGTTPPTIKPIWHVFRQNASTGAVTAVNDWITREAGKTENLSYMNAFPTFTTDPSCSTGGFLVAPPPGGSGLSSPVVTGGTGGTAPITSGGGTSPTILYTGPEKTSVGICIDAFTTGLWCTDTWSGVGVGSGTGLIRASACIKYSSGTVACKPYCSSIVTTNCCTIATPGSPTKAEEAACLKTF